MATYMYTSASGSNWDDDEDDFDFTSYIGTTAEFGAVDPAEITLVNARAALNELQSVIEREEATEATDSSTTTAVQYQVDYDIDPDYYPTYVAHATESWYNDQSHPAYVALSYEGGYAYPYERRNYSANWKSTKLKMGANMKHTMLMAPSTLRLTQTWTSDSIGEYVECRGYEHLARSSPQMPTPQLSHESESDVEQSEVQTPPDTPVMARVNKCEVEVEEYDPIVGAIDLPAHSIEAMELDMSQHFASFSSIADDLNVHQILGDAGADILHPYINEAAMTAIVSAMETRHAIKITIPIAEVSLAPSSLAEKESKTMAPAHSQVSSVKENVIVSPVDSKPLTKIPATFRSSSPDLRYIQDPSNTSLVWNTVALGWFALSSLPWGRITVAAAGVLFDTAACIARR